MTRTTTQLLQPKHGANQGGALRPLLPRHDRLVNASSSKYFCGLWAVVFLLCVALLPANLARATYTDLIGFPELQAQLGATIPTGDGVEVQLVEANAGGNYLPDTSVTELGAPNIVTNVTAVVDPPEGSTGTSGHATNVARNFFGQTTSISPDVNDVGSHSAGSWLQDGFLNAGNGATLPVTTDARISNHSWVGPRLNEVSPPFDLDENVEVLQRADFIVNEDDHLTVVGVPPKVANVNANRPILKDAFNVISVSITAGNGFDRTADLSQTGDADPTNDTDYTGNRVSVDLVAPGFTHDEATVASSFATPMVSAAAALLVETAQDSSLSIGDTAFPSNQITNRTRTIYHAETSEVIKAVLMAGADREVDNARGADLTTYVINSNNNLDSQFGAGQVNIFNSYNILADGEQNSSEDGGPAAIDDRGWDYDPSFGGGASSNSTASYSFAALDDADSVTATLTWNLDVEFSGATISTTLENFNLELFNVTTSTSVQSSMSTDQNTENIFMEGLTAGHTYELRVTSVGVANWDYGLAWQVTRAVPEPTTAVLALLATSGLALTRRRVA